MGKAFSMVTKIAGRVGDFSASVLNLHREPAPRTNKSKTLILDSNGVLRLNLENVEVRKKFREQMAAASKIKVESE